MITWGDISGFIDNIKSALWSWVDDIARYWVQRAYEFYDILKHTWDDVLDAVENAKAYAEYLLKDVWSEFDKVWTRISAIPVLTYDVIIDWVRPLFENAKSYAEDIVSDALGIVDNLVNDIWNNIDNVWDSINDIFNVQIPDLRNSIQSVWEWINNADNWIDNKINEFKDKILGWVEESFITIVEHVLEMNIGGKR
ncbi:MAG: hypothetical protein DRO11_08330 [Methanobacteriota archaeon]|nr:MAG: hypothetical protein DRO11_08330 [Euryarchaeota archaeon]